VLQICRKTCIKTELKGYICLAMPLPPLPDFVPVMKAALVFYRGFRLMKIEAIKPIPTITSTTFQISRPKAILING